MHRFLLPAAAIVSMVLVAAVMAGWFTLHTVWFMNLVRGRIVAMAERATGGRVEIGTFSYNTNLLTAETKDFVIHGTEPAGAPPLLRVQGLQVGLKILSLWKRDVDLESLTLDRPEIHVMISAGGETNVPQPKARRKNVDPLQELLQLKIKHVELRDGLLALNEQRVPLDFKTDNVSVGLTYNAAGPSYDVALALPASDVKVRQTAIPVFGIASKARLFHNAIQFESLKVTSKRSSVKVSGRLERFDHPSGDLAVDGSFAVDDLTGLIALKEIQSGRANTQGALHLDGGTSRFIYTGRAQARDVNYVSRPFTLKGMRADGQITADNHGMWISHATASARGASFAGSATIKHYRFLQVNGNVSRVLLSEVGTYLTDRAFPWSGAASGTAFASATLSGAADPNFVIGAQVAIAPEAGPIPTSGVLGVTYFNRTGRVVFGQSQLALPHSQLGFSGDLDTDLNVTADSTNLADLQPVLPIIQARVQAADIPFINAGGRAHFSGALHNLNGATVIRGDVSLAKMMVHGQTVDSLQTTVSFSSNALQAANFQLNMAGATASGGFSLGLVNWLAVKNQPGELNARFTGLNIVKTAALFSSVPLPFINGIASGTVNLAGSADAPRGNAKIRIANLDAYGETINQAGFNADLANNTLKISQGRVQAGAALLMYSGDYRRQKNDWTAGELHVRADTNGFPLGSLSTFRKYLPAAAAQAEAHFDAAFKIGDDGVTPLRADGTAFLRKVSINGKPYGEATFKADTQGTALTLDYQGKLLQTAWQGKAEANLVAGTPVHGDVQMGRLDFATLKTLISASATPLPLNGFLEGGMQFSGSLQQPEKLRADLNISQLEISSQVKLGAANAAATEIVLRNRDPIVLQAANGVATVRSFEITGNDTSVTVSGNAPYVGNRPLDLKAVGKANLQIFSLFDNNVQSSGASEIAINIGGALLSPSITGALEVTNGSFFLNGLPNGLSAVNGTVVFGRNRATIQKMTAKSGGGDLSLGGFVSLGAGTPVVYHVEAAAQNVRVRYANSISVTANSNLRLSGTSASSILSGTLTVSRVVFTPNADAGNLLAALGASASPSGDEGDFLTGLHLDIGVESAPNLQVSTNLSRDVEAEIQLRLRGTPDHPILLGSITANQGDLRVFGTRYSLNRGEVSFVNTVRAEPVLDLDLETQTRGVTVDITVSGTPSKLNFNYRSDPPLQPRDIIALLTVGRAPGVGTASNAQTGNDVSALKSGVNSVLGQAISPVSGRLSRLFGITNIRIDPFVQGITNTPQARLSVEQQISRDITITYITNLSQTSEQIFRLEWALNRQFSIVALRDDNGEFGLDFQYKKRFK